MNEQKIAELQEESRQFAWLSDPDGLPRIAEEIRANTTLTKHTGGDGTDYSGLLDRLATMLRSNS